MALSTTLSPMTAPYTAGGTARAPAIEGLTRSLTGEYDPAEVRVNCVRGSGLPETRTIQETGAGCIDQGATPSLVPPDPCDRDADTHAFLLSDLAAVQVLTISAGAFIDLESPPVRLAAC